VSVDTYLDTTIATLEGDLATLGRDLAALDAQRVTLEERRTKVIAAIEALRVIAGPPAPKGSPEAAPPVPVSPSAAVPAVRPATPAAASAPKRAQRSRTTDAILSALRAAGAPMAPAALAKAVGLSSTTMLRYHLTPLLRTGQVVETGQSSALRFALASTPAVPAAPPAPPAAAPSTPATSADPAHVVAARDAAIAAHLVTCRDRRATFEQLLAVLPEEPDQTAAQRREACQRALRRLTMRGVIVDVGAFYRLIEP
jgi:hypothetical protein